MTEPTDNTRTTEGAAPATDHDATRGVLGGDPDRMDPAGEGTGGVPSGADGETGAREQQRKDLGERSSASGTEEGDDLEQSAALGPTDDSTGGSIQEHGGRPA